MREMARRLTPLRLANSRKDIFADAIATVMFVPIWFTALPLHV
tara:strand:- start:249 stop:377 length:129 start_codon:yes stop_codon:yes gene_type:complete